MQAIDLTKPGEKKKLIWAAILGFGALIVLWWVVFGFGDSNNTNKPRASASPTPARNVRPGTQQQPAQPVSDAVATAAMIAPIDYTPSSYNAPEAERNIFAYVVAKPKPSPVIQVPTPSPPPPPPILLASISPSNVYARSADFKLEVAGDKFTPATKIYFEGQELQTTYISPQQLAAKVSAAQIAAPGSRNIVVRTSDNSLFSAPVMLTIAAPPIPNYLYVGIISPNSRVDDVAIVQDKSNKNIMNVHRGDLLSGRFRVTSISDKELVMMDTNLKIPHKLAMTESDKSFNNPLTRPTPRVESEDDEP